MVDPALPVTAVTTAYLVKPYLEKILGPTSEYIGDKLRDLVKNRIENISKICEKAIKLDLKGNINKPGAVSPRIIYELTNSGSFIEDELTQIYFAGVLLASRTEESADDRGLYYLDIIRKLSKFDIKLHFYLYLAFRAQYLDAAEMFFIYTEREKISVYLPLSKIFTIFMVDAETCIPFADRIKESLARLSNEGLISHYFISNLSIEVQKKYPNAEEGGIVISPSQLGAKLFLWGLGINDMEPHYLCSQGLPIERRIEQLGFEIRSIN